MLWRQRIVLGAALLIGLALALVRLAVATRLYTGTARLTVQAAGSRLSDIAPDASQSSGNFLYTQRERIISTPILALTLARPGIRELKTFKDETNRLAVLKDNLDVQVGKKDDTIAVEFESPFRDDAATISNAIVNAYIDYQTKPRQSNTENVLAALQNRRAAAEQELADKVKQMSALEQQYGLLANDQDNLTKHRLSTISQELALAQEDARKAQVDFDQAVKAVRKAPGQAKADPAAGIFASAEDEAMLRTQLVQAQSRLQELRQQYLPDHPSILQMQRRVDQLGVAFAAAVERRLLVARDRVTDLQKDLDEQQKKAVEVDAKTAQYLRLQADADRIRKEQIDTLENRIHSIELTRDSGTVDIDFFEPAEPPLKPSHPHGLTTIAMGLLLGLALGVALALSRDWVDDRLRSADEVKAALGMPLLGVIPQMPGNVARSVAGQKIISDPTSDVAEAYRSVRTAVHFGAPKDRSKTILVTSPAAGDGKTTLASNLAIAMAQAGKRVLLIDADLRNPMQHTIFSVRDRVGLSSLLNGEGPLDRVIQATAVDGLDIIPCGPKPANPSEMLNSPMFNELLESLAEKYDHILIDSPPVMGLTDARIISASCDVTVVVLRADKSTRKQSALARDGLLGVGATVLGVVVNDVARNNDDFYGAYGYGKSRDAAKAAATLEPSGIKPL